jgi:putative tricarboxylic transport membrane protein
MVQPNCRTSGVLNTLQAYTAPSAIHGLQPGPLMISQRPEVFWGFVASMYIGNLMLLIMDVPLVGLFVTVLRLPQHVLATLVLLLCLVGAFSLSNSFLDLWVLVIFGVFGYVLRKLRVGSVPDGGRPGAGPDDGEGTLRQALFLTRGSVVDLVARPLSATILLLAAAALRSPPLLRLARGRRGAARARQPG